ncbi:MAG: sigma-E factor negative regulatory protein [Dokdonella sp.]|uniref:sigma-E factor negative regulatory protein n=1 Tax=Dokdonella sp. TaxID=2291710 RepID=UPI003264FD89
MNEHIHEQISALMDGQLERDETRFLLKRLPADHALAARWSRYHVARQALRRQDITATGVSFAEGVMARLDADQPALHAPGVSRWMRWSAGGAIAASVAVAALVVTRPVGDVSPAAGGASTRTMVQQGAPIPVATVAASTSYPAGFLPPLLAPNAPVDASPVSFGTDSLEPLTVDPRMQSYLIRHYQAAGAAGQSGLVPYVLIGSQQRDAAVKPAEATSRNR